MSTTPGLRERKKAKTRAAIQTQALRLIAEQGYEATTVEQIAEAAEISPSTFFRYFPTKEDVVVEDDYDPLLVVAFGSAGASDRPLTRRLRFLRCISTSATTKSPVSTGLSNSHPRWLPSSQPVA